MLTCQITEKALFFEWSSDAAVKGTITCTCAHFGGFSNNQLHVLAEATKKVCARISENSYNTVFKGLRVIIESLRNYNWPEHDDVGSWQNTVVTMFQKTIQNKRVSLDSRISYWNAGAQILKALSRMGVIPTSVVLPHAKGGDRSDEKSTPPLGHKSKKTPIATAMEGVLPKNFMIEQNLELPDDLYLSKFKLELESSVELVSKALHGYWEEMIATHEIGSALIATIPIEERKNVIHSDGIGDDGVHVCSHTNPDALAWFLLLVKNYFDTGKISAISAEEVHRSPLGLSLGRTNALFRKAKSACPNKYINATPSNEYVSRLLGMLSIVDCNAAIAILVINNPVFTAESISAAALYMDNGDCYIQVDTENGLVRFSVSKPRAMSRKVAHLNRISREIISKIVECTKNIRILLKQQKRPSWKRLFLYAASRGPATQPGKISNNKEDKNSLKTRIAVDLTSFKGKIDLSPRVLRATQGIITFLRTGSLAVASIVLGNTIAVTESNYIPKWLVRRFGNRTLRILAQKMIVVSTHGRPWALAASDFTTMEHLHLFIVRILNEATGNDPFAIVARRRLSGGNETIVTQNTKSGSLHLHISDELLAALYAFEAKVLTLPEDEQLAINPSTNLSHRAICNIAQVSRLSAELDIDGANEADIQIASNFCGESLEELRMAHKMALDQVKKYDSLFINIRTSSGHSASQEN
ncbi:hypothetical protein NPS29_00250 [Pseudomonas putida]|uniref:hypothetical protein n=1 Tax=Pseudomonas putida TaxID=303 RepID=UPI00236335E2|nr:hypothetical protein [Pseudomonas putida]MDD1963741.1 hypothetical protein [Pseudomonas putida]